MTDSLVLYVEDVETDVVFVQRAFAYLRSAKPLRVVRDGREAVDYLAGNGRFSDRQRYPLPGLVLLDLKLPGLRGFEVLQWIRQHPQFRSLPVVIFSASALEADQERAREMGANEYVVKPNDMSAITGLLQGVCDRWLASEPSSRNAVSQSEQGRVSQ
jgi:CheY-like chemotaxis protein